MVLVADTMDIRRSRHRRNRASRQSCRIPVSRRIHRQIRRCRQFCRHHYASNDPPISKGISRVIALGGVAAVLLVLLSLRLVRVGVWRLVVR